MHEGKDRDEREEEPTGLGIDGDGRRKDPGDLQSLFHELPRGARAGEFIHSILEELDFRDTGAIEPLAREKLLAHGYPESLLPSLCTALTQALHTPMLESGLTLSDVPTSRRLNELELHLPLAVARGSVQEPQPLTSKSLARVFEQTPGGAVPAGYAAQLGTLGFAPLAGFLKGFVDLVFEHAGRFYVVDYKTNTLGAQIGDYSQPALNRAMVHGHYFLQYHLYTLGVHRYLSRRIPDYAYETHFGGALYLFLRGMHPEAGPSYGVFYDKPSHARVQALSDLFDGVREEGRS